MNEETDSGRRVPRNRHEEPTPPPLPAPPEPSGADQLIAQAERAIIGAHDAVVQHIDDMIEKLESVKRSVQIKKEGAVAQLKEFITIAASGLDTVKQLETKMEQLIRNHLN